MRIWPSRCASSCVIPAYGSQLTSPSSSTAKGWSVSETSATSPSASAQPANPCAGPRQRPLYPWRCCVHRPSASRWPLQPLDARRHVEPQLATRENRAGTAPHQLAPLISFVRGDQLRQALEIRLRRCEPLQHQPDSRLAPPEAALGVLGRKICRRLERALQIRRRSLFAARRSHAPQDGGAQPRLPHPRDTASETAQPGRRLSPRPLGASSSRRRTRSPRRRRWRRSPSAPAPRSTVRPQAARAPPE